MDRDTVLQVPVQVTDPDGNPLTLTFQGLPSFATFTPTGSGQGTLRFAPVAQDRGNYTLTVQAADDGDGGGAATVLRASYSFVLTVRAANEPPRLDFVGNRVAVVGQELVISLNAFDADQEPLTFTVTGLPAAATLAQGTIYGTAALRWTPTANDLGVYDVTFRVADSGNGNPALAASHSRPVRVTVRDSNRAPTLVAVGNQTVAEGATLTVQLSATDPDGDSLVYSAAGLPAGARLDPATGRLTWVPGIFEAGDYPGVTFTATDGNRSASETVALRVTNTNQAPVLAPMFAQRAREGTELQFTLAAGDIDGDRVTVTALGLPAGAVFDPQSLQFRWTPGFEQDGSYTVTFRASDGGLSDQIQVPIAVENVNRAPTLTASHHGGAIGMPLAFTARATDPDLNTTLTFAAANLPQGATFNAQTGAFAWTPGPTQAGEHVVVFSVTDGEDVISKSVLLRVTSAPVPPLVSVELTPSFPAVPGQRVQLQATASSLAPITALTLRVNGQALTTDAQGRAEFTPSAQGKYVVEATATDADGLVGRFETVLKVRDPNDTAAPVVRLDQRLSYARLGAATAITGAVSDVNLDTWTLDLAPLGSHVFTRVASGGAPVSGALYTFDPTRLPNGLYRLRLTATDIAGRANEAELVVEANSAAKPSQYLQSQTDLTVNLGGVPVSLVRMYDSLRRDRDGLLGFGWRLVNRDFQVEAGVPPTGREGLGVYNPFRVGTRVHVTLPDGRRVGFTFNPVRRQLPGLTFYEPAFTADSGVTWRLSSAPALLTLAGDRLHELVSGRPYHPASGQFTGPEYVLTAPDGTVYQVSTARGVEVQINPDGRRLYFSDGGITSATGEVLRFGRDESGRLSELVAPDCTRVIYTHDAAGNLVSARNLALGQSSRYGYAAADPYLLTLAVSPAGGSAIKYGATPQVLPVTADLGGSGQFTSAAVTGTLTAGGAARYAFAVRPSELRSTPSGKVFLSVVVEAASGSTLQPALPVITGLAPRLSEHRRRQRVCAVRAGP